MKLSRQFTVFGSAIFCVVIFSLYLMLDRGHLDYPKGPRREGSFPQVSTEEVGVGGVVTRCSSPSTSRGGSALGHGEPEQEEDRSLLPARLCGVGVAVTAIREPPPLPGRAELTKCGAACCCGIVFRSGQVPVLSPGPVRVPSGTCWRGNACGARRSLAGAAQSYRFG